MVCFLRGRMMSSRGRISVGRPRSHPPIHSWRPKAATPSALLARLRHLLAAVKRLAEAMGGNVRCESRPGSAGHARRAFCAFQRNLRRNLRRILSTNRPRLRRGGDCHLQRHFCRGALHPPENRSPGIFGTSRRRDDGRGGSLDSLSSKAESTVTAWPGSLSGAPVRPTHPGRQAMQFGRGMRRHSSGI